MRRCGNLGSSSIVQLATTSRVLSGSRTRPTFAIWNETRPELSSDCAPLAFCCIFSHVAGARVNLQLPPTMHFTAKVRVSRRKVVHCCTLGRLMVMPSLVFVARRFERASSMVHLVYHYLVDFSILFTRNYLVWPFTTPSPHVKVENALGSIVCIRTIP